MNILPKKRWHVRTKDNIARVRKDEAEARFEELERLRRKELAQKEARINDLRNKARGQDEQPLNYSSKHVWNKCKHVNLFADYEDGLAHTNSINKEYQKEQLEKSRSYEKKIGLLTLLGQDTNEALKLKSWYEKPPVKLYEHSSHEEADAKTKYRNDPLHFVKSKHVKQITMQEPQIGGITKFKTKAEKNLKNAEKKIVNSKIKKSVEKMREERLRRESMEKRKQELTLLRAKGLSIQKQDMITSNNAQTLTQKYNNQFNPHIAKQNIQ